MSNSSSNSNVIRGYQKDINRISKILGFFAVLLIVFSIIAPWLFTQKTISVLDLSNTGAIGDSIGGIMNPFIGLAGIILTFLAFYLQYKANQIQIENFNTQLLQDRTNFQNQINQQNNEFLKNQIESQFFEMIRLHKENINEMSLEVYSDFEKVKTSISGRKVFIYFLDEVNLIYETIKKHMPDEDKEYRIHLAFHYFFNGLSFKTLTYPTHNEKIKNTFFDLSLLVASSYNQPGVDGVETEEILKNYDGQINHKILVGHSNFLGHYYRHLFHTVKFIANQDEENISYGEKRRYLRLLRAQISNEEQALLFYNWKSNFGANWESNENKFFSDYRMIHNLQPKLLHLDFDIEYDLRLNNDLFGTYRTELNRKDDYLFEFQKKQK